MIQIFGSYIERWWNSFKHEQLYLQQYATMRQLREGIAAYVQFYNERRFHQALSYRRPAEVFAEAEVQSPEECPLALSS